VSLLFPLWPFAFGLITSQPYPPGQYDLRTDHCREAFETVYSVCVVVFILDILQPAVYIDQRADEVMNIEIRQ
jgi:hypothetical protein